MTANKSLILGSSFLDEAVLPDVCVRHGLPVRHRNELVVGGARHHLNAEAVRRANWPLCSWCLNATKRLRRGATAMGILGAVLMIVAIGSLFLEGPAPFLFLLILVGGPMILFSVRLNRRATVAWVARATLSRDGTTVTLAHPSTRFVKQWRDRNKLA